MMGVGRPHQRERQCEEREVKRQQVCAQQTRYTAGQMGKFRSMNVQFKE